MDTSAFIQRFEAATGELSAARETLVSELRDFSAEAARMELPVTTLDEVAGRIDEQYAAAEATERAALESARTRLEQTHQQLNASVVEMLAAAQSEAAAFEALTSSRVTEVAAEQQTYIAAVSGLEGAAREHEQRIEAAASSVADAQTALKEALAAHETELSSELTPGMVERIEAYADAVHGEMTAAIEAAFQQGSGVTSEAFQATSAVIAQSFSEALADLDRSAQEISSHVGESLRSNLEEGADKLVQGATQRMAEEVIEGVVTSEVGVAVTTALGPYLPALIAIKRATDVIKHGLELLKKVTTLGMG